MLAQTILISKLCFMHSSYSHELSELFWQHFNNRPIQYWSKLLTTLSFEKKIIILQNLTTLTNITN